MSLVGMDGMRMVYEASYLTDMLWGYHAVRVPMMDGSVGDWGIYREERYEARYQMSTSGLGWYVTTMEPNCRAAELLIC